MQPPNKRGKPQTLEDVLQMQCPFHPKGKHSAAQCFQLKKCGFASKAERAQEKQNEKDKNNKDRDDQDDADQI
jgi:hypothetical protein